MSSDSTRARRVVILADANTHMMPALARDMASRDHDLVLGDAADGLAGELTGMGVSVEVVPDAADQTRPDTIQKLVDRARDVFGGFDSACIRTGTHGGGDILAATAEDCDTQYEGNFRSVFYALQALLPPLIAQKSGQVVIGTSAGGLRMVPESVLYCSTRAGANAMIQCAAQTAAPHGVSVNATGTYAMDYPSFLHDVGADTDPAKRKEAEEGVPLKRLCSPEEAAYFVAGLLDGQASFVTSQFFPIDGGWSAE